MYILIINKHKTLGKKGDVKKQNKWWKNREQQKQKHT